MSQHPTTKRYTLTEKASALTRLVFNHGDTGRTAREIGIAPRTLQDWKNRHLDLYLEIQEREAPKLEAIATAHAREIILRASEAEHKVLDRIFTDNPEGDELSSKQLAELGAALQRVSTSKGINTTKLLELTGRPTTIVEHRDGADILRALAARVPGLVIDGSAEEIGSSQTLPAGEQGKD